MIVSEHVKDQILNGLQVGMPYEDMLIMAELSPEQILVLQEDTIFMSRVKARTKVAVYDLLQELHNVIDVQVDKGKDHAITWLLERLEASPFKPSVTEGENTGIVNIYTSNVDIDKSDTVEVFNPEQPED